MEGEQHTRKSNWSGIWCTAILTSLLIGYPLSIGPVACLAKHGYLPQDLEGQLAIRIVYAPIIWMFEHWGWYHDLHLRYLELWGI